MTSFEFSSPGDLVLGARGLIVFEQLGHGLQEILIILVRILLDVESLCRSTSPDQLTPGGIDEVDHQLADVYR